MPARLPTHFTAIRHAHPFELYKLQRHMFPMSIFLSADHDNHDNHDHHRAQELSSFLLKDDTGSVESQVQVEVNLQRVFRMLATSALSMAASR